MPRAVAKKSSTPLFIFLGCAALLMIGLMIVLMIFVIWQMSAGGGAGPLPSVAEEPQDKAGGLRPEGYFISPTLPTTSGPLASQPGQENRRFVVIVLHVPSRAFIPSQAEFDELRKHKPGLRPALDKYQDKLESVRYYLPRRFRIQVVDTGRQNAAEYLDMKTGSQPSFAPYQIDLLHKTATPYPTATLAVAWHLDARDCVPPFRVQFESHDQVQVPDKRITAWKTFKPPAN